jgi:hypothetical protein
MTEYWEKYDLLCSDLKKDGDLETFKELLEVKKYVNGLTDGWFDFLVGFEKIIETNKMKNEYRKKASEMTTDLRKMLENRK